MQKIKIILIVSIVALVASGCALKKEEQEDALSKNNNNSIVATFGQDQTNNQILDTMQDNSNNATIDPSTPSSAIADSVAQDDGEIKNQIITLKTNMGDIKIELFLEKMPITAGNFLKLAKANFYDGVTFHRVIPDFMIQGGDPLSKDDDPNNDGTGGPGYFIEDEFSADFTNERGTLSMANAGAGTGGSQFFVNIADNSYLDFNKEPVAYKHPVFGRVLEGMDIVDAISAVERDGHDRPLENVVIQDVLVE